MNNLLTTLPGWQRERLALLLDALDSVAISDAERRSLEWLSGWEAHTVANIATVIARARQSGRVQIATSAPGATTPAPSPAYTELSNAITRTLTLTREAGCALTTAGQTLTGLSSALADVVAAATPEMVATATAGRVNACTVEHVAAIEALS